MSTNEENGKIYEFCFACSNGVQTIQKDNLKVEQFMSCTKTLSVKEDKLSEIHEKYNDKTSPIKVGDAFSFFKDISA